MSVTDDFYNSLAEPVLAEQSGNDRVLLSMRNEDCITHVAKPMRNFSGCFPATGYRVHAFSTDGGLTYGSPSVKDRLHTGGYTELLPDPTVTLGCQASLLRVNDTLFFSNPADKDRRINVLFS
jgi:hypothetical protein